MIKCTSLSYTVNGKMILDNVDLLAEKGKITVVIGKNGSGKTTLVRAISAFHEHRRNITGEITLDGLDVLTLSARELSSRLALLPQSMLAPAITLRELVTLGRASRRSPFASASAEDRAAVDAAIDALSLSSLADSTLDKLSGGERQLAYLAMMLAKDAPSLILDEPSSSLDAKNRKILFDTLRRMREEGRAVLAVLHDLTDAACLADRILVLDEGHVAFDGTPEELRESRIPADLFGLMPMAVQCGDQTATVYLSLI